MDFGKPGTLEQQTPPSTYRPPSGSPSGPRWWLWFLILVALGVAVYFLMARQGTSKAGASSKAAAQNARGPAVIPVVAAQARKGAIGVYYTALGAVTPIHTVTVKSRVDGELMQVYYREGDLVRQGDRLAEIDPRPYRAALTQAEGQLTKDQALLDNARLDLARYQTLLTQNAIPEQQLATQKALVAQYEGMVKMDQGQVESAILNLSYCHIKAPISGRVGLRLVDPGNIVRNSDTSGLLVITQLQPISVIFTLAEDHLPVVLQAMRAQRHLAVDVYDRALTTRIASGRLMTIDNQIDQTTGTVKLRAHFDNRDNALFPNQFVNVRLLVEEKHGVILLPTAAVQRNSGMAYVYVVGKDSTVSVRPIAVGTTEGEEAEITAGLTPGDIVVTTGVDKLKEGSAVKVHLHDEKNPQGS